MWREEISTKYRLKPPSTSTLFWGGFSQYSSRYFRSIFRTSLPTYLDLKKMISFDFAATSFIVEIVTDAASSSSSSLNAVKDSLSSQNLSQHHRRLCCVFVVTKSFAFFVAHFLSPSLPSWLAFPSIRHCPREQASEKMERGGLSMVNGTDAIITTIKRGRAREREGEREEGERSERALEWRER